MKVETKDGLAWLDAMAEQYESAARDLRAMRTRLSTLPLVPTTQAPAVGGEILVGEAIREALITGGPGKALALVDRIDWSRVKTRSKDRVGLVSSTLSFLHDKGFVRRVGRGVWDVERGGGVS